MSRRGDAVGAPTVRLFVAVDPPADAAAHLGSFVDNLMVSRANTPGHSTRLADRSSWHVTLAFLGEVAADRVEAATSALTRAAAPTPGPIRLRLTGGGRFGRGRYTIMWTALGGDLPGLGDLAARVRAELKRARLSFDHKPFRPHLTLARPGDRLSHEEVDADLAALAGYDGPWWTVEAVHLYRSEMHQTTTGPRPVYTRVVSEPLPAAEPVDNDPACG